jgi:hypothetical protein
MTTLHMAPTPLVTVDVRDLHSLRWGFLRGMFPKFIEDLELGHYLNTLLSGSPGLAVHIEPHRDADGQLSTHVIDVYILE